MVKPKLHFHYHFIRFNCILFFCVFLFSHCSSSGTNQSVQTENISSQELKKVSDHLAAVPKEKNPSISLYEDSLLQNDSCGCPPEGNAKLEHVRELNKLKNRSLFPAAENFNVSITLEKLLEPGEDTKRWSNHEAAKIRGYVWDVKPGGMETVNCKAKDKKMRDAHIELVLDPMNVDKRKIMVVEITPRVRSLMFKKGEDWTTSAIKSKFLGRWVEVEGWMMLDVEHTAQAENTNPGRPRNWRGTAWEIHPVTSIKVVSRYK